MEDLINQKIEDDKVWHRDFYGKKNGGVSGAAMKSKMLVVTTGGRTGEIYDFWPDREYEDMDSEDSEDDDLDDDDSDYGVEDENE